MKTILLTGAAGQVGWELQKTLKQIGKVHAFDRKTLDLQNPAMIREVVRQMRPDIIVNAAAYTAVDLAESNQEAAHDVNALAPKILAEEAKHLGALLVHYSTDYVFDGNSRKPYKEEDSTNPLNVYGKTKLEGEKFIQEAGGKYLIFRTSWVYGMRGKNFLLTMLRLAKEKETLRIVSDQLGSPTWCYSIAEATAKILSNCFQNKEFTSGLYHLSSSGVTSWHGFAEAIFDSIALSESPNLKIPNLVKIATEEYPLPAKRPLYSALSHDKLNRVFNVAMPDWNDALKCCIETLHAPKSQ